jgi:hypothetical protein
MATCTVTLTLTDPQLTTLLNALYSYAHANDQRTNDIARELAQKIHRLTLGKPQEFLRCTCGFSSASSIELIQHFIGVTGSPIDQHRRVFPGG